MEKKLTVGGMELGAMDLTEEREKDLLGPGSDLAW